MINFGWQAGRQAPSRRCRGISIREGSLYDTDINAQRFVVGIDMPFVVATNVATMFSLLLPLSLRLLVAAVLALQRGIPSTTRCITYIVRLVQPARHDLQDTAVPTYKE